MNINKSVIVSLLLSVSLFAFAGCGKGFSFPFDPDTDNARFSLGDVYLTGRADPFSDGLSVVTGDVNISAIEDMKIDQSAGLLAMSEDNTVYALNMHDTRSPASLTKVMTALVALRNMSAETMLTAREDIVVKEKGATLLGINAGDRMTLDQALHFLLMESDNDVALFIAENVSGTVEAFIEQMNQEALRIGATNCTFVNPSGLTAEGHEVTAYDLYLIMREAVNYPAFVETISCSTYSTSYTKGDGSTAEKEIKSTVGYTQGEVRPPGNVNVIGGKTGTTAAAGRCLMLYVKNSLGTPYIAIVMHAADETELYHQMNELLALLEQGQGQSGG